jgi:hypothetical protein
MWFMLTMVFSMVWTKLLLHRERCDDSMVWTIMLVAMIRLCLLLCTSMGNCTWYLYTDHLNAVHVAVFPFIVVCKTHVNENIHDVLVFCGKNSRRFCSFMPFVPQCLTYVASLVASMAWIMWCLQGWTMCLSMLALMRHIFGPLSDCTLHLPIPITNSPFRVGCHSLCGSLPLMCNKNICAARV